MRSNTSYPFEGFPLKPDENVPGTDACTGNEFSAEIPAPLGLGELPLPTRLKFVRVGLWEARRRWLAGQTTDLGELLAHLDEDLDQLCQALDPEEEACSSAAPAHP